MQGALLEAVLDAMPFGIVVAGAGGRVLTINRAARLMVGMDPTPPAPTDWPGAYGAYLPDRSVFPVDELPLVRALRGEETRGIEMLLRRDDDTDEERRLSIDGIPLRDAAGAVVGGAIVIRDVGLEPQTRQLIQRLSSAVETTADSVMITGRDGVIEYVNPAFERTTGYRREDALGRTPGILKSGEHDAEVYEGLWRTLLRGDTFRGTLVNRKKGGGLYHSEQTMTPMMDDGGRITHFVAVARDITERRAREQQELEVQLANRIQRRLQPLQLPRVPGFDVGGVSEPASAMCGDYFDCFRMADDRLGIVVADASGHGIGAALLATEARAYVRSLCHSGASVGEILGQASERLAQGQANSFFVTMLLACLDPVSATLTYASAGHIPGYVLDRHGDVRQTLLSTSLPLGLFPERGAKGSRTVPLEPGDLVLLLTDGVTEAEAHDGSSFDIERVLDRARGLLHEPADAIARELCVAVGEFRGSVPQHDDVTVVACRVTGDSAPLPARSPRDTRRSTDRPNPGPPP